MSQRNAVLKQRPLAAVVRSDWSRHHREARRMEQQVFAFDPFQAKTLPVFESIFRYGRDHAAVMEAAR